MTRRQRLESPTAIYHVMLRGINRQRLFEEPADFEMFLELLSKVKEQSEFALFAYCLMGNHAHILIRTGNEPLSVTMKRFSKTEKNRPQLVFN